MLTYCSGLNKYDLFLVFNKVDINLITFDEKDIQFNGRGGGGYGIPLLFTFFITLLNLCIMTRSP